MENLRIYILSILTITTVIVSSIANSGEPTLTHIDIFPNEGNSHYRIPSIVTANDGTILAFCNRRVGSVADKVLESALVLRRSKDGGKSWLPIQDIYARKGWRVGIGSVIVDVNTGEIMVIHSRLPGTQFAKRQNEKSMDITGRMIARSADSGNSWRFDKMNITPNSIGKLGHCHGSGTGITLRFGPSKSRLLMPARFALKKGEGANNLKKNHHNCAIYSDDHGKTWKTSEPVQAGTGEGCLVELSNGIIYYNSRAYFHDGKRRIALSNDGGKTFESFSKSDVLTECNHGTNAALLGVPPPFHEKHVILFANPPIHAKGSNLNRDRRRITVRLSFDDAKTWPKSKVIFEGPSGYSSLTLTNDGTVLLLYEKGRKVYSDNGISLARFKVDWLTNN